MFLLFALAGADADLTVQVQRAVTLEECGADASEDDVLVCARRKQRQRYRLPELDGPVDLERATPNAVRERAKWIEEGDGGTGSCGPVGPGGASGCMQKRWKKLRQQKKGWFGI